MSLQSHGSGGPKAGWRSAGKFSVLSAITPVVIGAGAGVLVTTAGFAFTIPMGMALFIRRYYASIRTVAGGEVWSATGLIDVNDGGFTTCIAEYGSFVTSPPAQRAAGVAQGIRLSGASPSHILVDDWYEYDDYRDIGLNFSGVPGALRGFGIRSLWDVFNSDGAAAHNIQWQEGIFAELWSNPFIA